MRRLPISTVFAFALTTLACAPPSTDESAPRSAGAALTGAPAVLAADATGFVKAATTGSTGLVVWQNAAGLSAQRLDATGAPLGVPVALGLPYSLSAYENGLAVAGGDGVFAVVTAGKAMSVRRIDQNGTLLDAAWAPLTPTYPNMERVKDVSVAFDGSQFVATFVHNHPDANYFNDELSSLTFPTTGPLTPGPGVKLEGGLNSYIDYSLRGVACAGAVCGRLFTRICGGPYCQIGSANEGLFFRVGGTSAKVAEGGPASLAASDTQLLVTSSACQEVTARLFDTAGSPIGNPVQVAPLPATSEHTATFDGADFAVAWKAVGGGAVDVLANWVSPAGDVAFPTSDPAAASPSNDDQASLASFGGGSALLATRAGGNIEARILTKGIGPSPQHPAGPATALPDGSFGSVGITGGHAIAASGGAAMILAIDTSGSLVDATVDGQLHVTSRTIGSGVLPDLAVAASGTGYLGAVSDGGTLAVRRFAADGTPVDPVWTPLPYQGIGGVTSVGIWAGHDGTSYELFFGGGDLVCNPTGAPHRLLIPETGPLGPLDDATTFLGDGKVTSVSCAGSTCVALSPLGYTKIYLIRPAGEILYTPPGVSSIGKSAVAMAPNEGLLVIGASNGDVFGQRLDATGAPTGPLMPLGSGMNNGAKPSLTAVWDGQRFAVAWQIGAGGGDINANWVDAGGPLFPTGQMLVNEAENVTSPRLAPADSGHAYLTYQTSTSLQGRVKRVDPSSVVVCNDSVTIGPPKDIGASAVASYGRVLKTASGAFAAWAENDAQGNPIAKATRLDLAGTPLDVPPIDLGPTGSGGFDIASDGAGFVAFQTPWVPAELRARRLSSTGQPLGPWVTLETFSFGVGGCSAGFDGTDYVLVYHDDGAHMLRIDPSTLAIDSDTIITQNGHVSRLACAPPSCFALYFTYDLGYPEHLTDGQGNTVLVSATPDGWSTEALVMLPEGPAVVIEDSPLVHGISYSPGLALLEDPLFQFSDGPSMTLASAAYNGLSILSSVTVGSTDSYVRSSTPGSCNHVFQQTSSGGALFPLAPEKTVLLYNDAAASEMRIRIVSQQPGCQSGADCASGACAGGVCCASSCDDGEVCTEDTCSINGQTCHHAPVADGASCPGGTCLSGACAQSTGTGGAGGSTGTGGAGGSTTSSTTTTSTSTPTDTGGAGGATTTSTGGAGGMTTTTDTGGVGGMTTTTTGAGGVGGMTTSSTTTDSTGGVGGMTTTTGAGGETTASTGASGGTDTGTGGSGAGAASGASGGLSPGGGGCACRSGRSDDSSAAGAALFLAGLALSGARRRRLGRSRCGAREAGDADAILE